MDGPGNMIDISDKDITVRTAKASGEVILGAEALEVLRARQCPKGDVFETAKIAAINAVKQTPAIVPMCHNIPVEAVAVDFGISRGKNSVTVEVAVKTSAKTGVEMEALTGASAACLTVYDMLKYKAKEIIIREIKLLEKTGGRSGDFKRNG